jgi:hypothetical protein
LSLTLREEHRLRVLENMVLRRLFGPKRDEVTAGWRKLHNERILGKEGLGMRIGFIRLRIGTGGGLL